MSTEVTDQGSCDALYSRESYLQPAGQRDAVCSSLHLSDPGATSIFYTVYKHVYMLHLITHLMSLLMYVRS